MKMQNLLKVAMAVALGLVVQGAPRLASAAPVAAVDPPALVAPTPPTTVPEKVNERQLRYAEREAQSPQSADFKGEHGAIYISGGAGLVLLIVLLIVLL